MKRCDYDSCNCIATMQLRIIIYCIGKEFPTIIQHGKFYCDNHLSGYSGNARLRIDECLNPVNKKIFKSMIRSGVVLDSERSKFQRIDVSSKIHSKKCYIQGVASLV